MRPEKYAYRFVYRPTTMFIELSFDVKYFSLTQDVVYKLLVFLVFLVYSVDSVISSEFSFM